MGKGDKRSKRSKIIRGSSGKTRPKKQEKTRKAKVAGKPSGT
jgi:ribosomal small subunit protein bTHX